MKVTKTTIYTHGFHKKDSRGPARYYYVPQMTWETGEASMDFNYMLKYLDERQYEAAFDTFEFFLERAGSLRVLAYLCSDLRSMRTDPDKRLYKYRDVFKADPGERLSWVSLSKIREFDKKGHVYTVSKNAWAYSEETFENVKKAYRRYQLETGLYESEAHATLDGKREAAFKEARRGRPFLDHVMKGVKK